MSQLFLDLDELHQRHDQEDATKLKIFDGIF